MILVNQTHLFLYGFLFFVSYQLFTKIYRKRFHEFISLLHLTV